MNCEIEFLPVGEASKAGDAIIIRYGEPNAFGLMTIDGGNLDSGKQVVEHIRQNFGEHVYINHAVLTHSDADHASGLREILREIEVKNLWLHMPWAFPSETRKYFLDKTLSEEKLTDKIIKEYDIITEIVTIAVQKNIPINFPFAGEMIGPFRVLSPHREFYLALIPQFDRTPDPDQAAIEAAGFWIGKQPVSALGSIFDSLLAKVQKWVNETWEHERLKDGGVTNASNESSVVLYGDFGNDRRVLLTGDAGIRALTHAVYEAGQRNLPLQQFSFVQIPHHGSRRNVGPSVLNHIVGPILPRNTVAKFSAYVSAPKDDDTHPRKMVLNAFTRRGGLVIATQGVSKIHYGGFPARGGYNPVEPIPLSPQVEEYD